MMLNISGSQLRGQRFRSSNTFIVCSMSMALFTDVMLFAFMVPLLPYIFENRIGLDTSMTQRYTSIFVVEGAVVSIVSSPFIGDLADQVSSKKALLLGLLILTLIATVCLAVTESLQWLFVGRFFQSITGHALYTVGMATMAENIGSEHMGKISGLVSTVSAAGTCAGPVIAGFLFGIGGYWTAWVGPVIFLIADIIMRLLMIEKSEIKDEEERTSLMNERQLGEVEEITGWNFYFAIFQQRRFNAGMFCYFVFSMLIGTLESTIAVHVRDTFGWGVFPVGLLFASIEGPGMILAPLVGYLKDRVGSRIPTTIGFICQAPFYWFLGAAGDPRFPWAMGDHGKLMYSICTTSIGTLLVLLNGTGTIEATKTIDELEALQPGIFGANGGYSRAFSIAGVSWMSGLLVGPILADFMIEKFGYFELQCVLGVISLMTGLVASFNLGSPRIREVVGQE